MKFKINLFIALLLLFFASCVKDNSIIVSKKIDDIKISGLNTTYTATIDQLLEINPVVDKQFTADADLDYVWYAFTQATQFKADTIAKVKNLSVQVALKPDVYTLVLKVTDKNIGVFYKAQTALTVNSDFSPGIMILTQNNGQASLSFLNTVSGKFTEDVYQKINGESLGTNPTSVNYFPQRSSMPPEVVITCADDRGGVVLTPSSLVKNRNIRNSFVIPWAVSGPMNVQRYVDCPATALQDYLIIDGKICNRSKNAGEILFKTELIGLDYTASPVYFYEGSSRPTFFDTKNSRFVCHDGTGGILNIFSTITGAGTIDPNNVGLNPIYGGNSAGNNYFGVFESPAKDKRYILRYLCNGSARSFTATEKFEVTGTLTDVMNAQAFAATRSLKDYLFYAAAGKIYVYNVATKSGGLLTDLGAQVNINFLKFTVATTELKVGYTNAALAQKKGCFATYSIGTVGGITATQTRKNEGFCDKVIDISDKN